MPAKKPAPKKAKLSGAERGAMKDYLREKKGPTGEPDVLAKIKKMAPADRALAEKLHKLVKATAPELAPRTYYGMPAYAKDDKVVLFFQDAGKFKTRYCTLGFTDKAKLDDGEMWPTGFAVKALDEATVAALVKKALG